MPGRYASSAFLAKITSRLKSGGISSDVRIVLQDNSTYDVHRIILSAGSSFFDRLFNFNEPLHEYRLEEVSREAFEHILCWMYRQELRLTKDNVSRILKEAHYLDATEVVERCVLFVLNELCVDNAIGFESFAKIFQIAELQERCSRFVKYHFSLVSQSEEFLKMSAEDLLALLQASDLNAPEYQVWTAAMQWVRYDRTKRSSLVAKLISHVRIGQFTEEFFMGTFVSDLQPFRPLEQGVEKLLYRAWKYYAVLDDVTKVKRPLRTPAFAMPRLSQDVVLAFGGWTGGSASDLIESYDTRADRWTTLTCKDTQGSRGYMGVASIGTKIYLVGGTNGENHFKATSCFDVLTREFTTLGPMHSRRCYISLTAVDGYLYAMGGFDGTKRLKTMERYCPLTRQWSVMDSLSSSRSDAGCCTLGSRIYICGGFDGTVQLDTAEVYSPKTRKWGQLPKMSSRRSGVSCVALKDELYVLGGFDGNQRLKSCEKYDARLKKWIPIADMMTTRSNFSAVVVEDTIMVIGGFNGLTTSELVECYDPILNCWCSSSDLQVHRSALSVCVVPGICLPNSALEYYAYPNRHQLPEEKRVYERGLEQAKEQHMVSYDENDDVELEEPEQEDIEDADFETSSDEENFLPMN